MDVDEDDQSSRHCQMEVVSFFFFWQLRRTRNQDGDATAPHSRQITRHNRQDTHTHTRSMHHADTTRPLSTHRTPLDLPKKNAVHPGSEEALSSSRSVTAFGSVVPNLGLKNWTVGPRSTAMAGSRFGISGWGSLSRGGSWSQTAISQREREREREQTRKPRRNQFQDTRVWWHAAHGHTRQVNRRRKRGRGSREERQKPKQTNRQTNKEKKPKHTGLGGGAGGGQYRGGSEWPLVTQTPTRTILKRTDTDTGHTDDRFDDGAAAFD